MEAGGRWFEPSHPDHPRRAVRDLIFSMLLWIGSHTSYYVALPEYRPVIVFSHVQSALVIPGLRIIILQKNWDSCELLDRALLFEEVYHLVQYQNGNWYGRSKAEIEAEARRQVLAWVREVWPEYENARLRACSLPELDYLHV